MFENLQKLYRNYGGIKAVMTSWYFWVAAFLSVLSYEAIFDFSWVGITLSVLPSLTGFTIAAFAIIFAILDAEVIPPFLMGFFSRIQAAFRSFCIGVIPPMPMLGRSLL